MRNILTFLLLFTAVISFSGCAGKQQQGPLAESIQLYEDRINVRLDGANDAAVTEVFGKIVSSAGGVVDARRYSTVIVADNPQASRVFWRVSVDGIDAFQLQTAIMDMDRKLLRAGGNLSMEGVVYNYTMDEIAMLLGLRPGDATSREIQFVIDRELARDREMSGW